MNCCGWEIIWLKIFELLENYFALVCVKIFEWCIPDADYKHCLGTKEGSESSQWVTSEAAEAAEEREQQLEEPAGTADS